MPRKTDKYRDMLLRFCMAPGCIGRVRGMDLERLADLCRFGATRVALRALVALMLGFVMPGLGHAQEAGQNMAQDRAAAITVRSAILTFNPEAPAEIRLGALEYLGGLIMASDDGRFGGYSGLSLDGDGAGLWAISDRGHWLRLDFARDAAGLPIGVAQALLLPLLNETGKPLSGRRADAESLRRDADGDFWVAFEREHRVWRYANPLGRPQALPVPVPVPPAVQALPGNGGLEALALLAPDESPLLIAEEALLDMPGYSPVWLRRGGVWRRLNWRHSGDFRPTDAVGLPDGGLLVLERDFRWASGWAARLSRVSAADLAQAEDAVLQPRLLAEWARPYANDNLEGIDARPGPDGRMWIYLMSDDNHSRLQRSLLLVFKLLE